MHPSLRDIFRSTAILALAAWTLLCCCEKRLLAAWLSPGVEGQTSCCVRSPAKRSCCCSTENSSEPSPFASSDAGEAVEAVADLESVADLDSFAPSLEACNTSRNGGHNASPEGYASNERESHDGTCNGDESDDDESPEDQQRESDDREIPRGCCTACCLKFFETPSRTIVSLDNVGDASSRTHCAPLIARDFTYVFDAITIALSRAGPPPRPPGPPPERASGLPPTILVSARWRM